jgi:IclR family acetate operon transcriptional repressor
MLRSTMRKGDEETTRNHTGGVAVLGKAVDLLEGLGDGAARSVAELAAMTGVTKSAAYRILSTLESRGWVSRQEPVRRYTLGPSLLALRPVRRSTDDLIPIARPFMQGLWEAFGETVNLGIITRRLILYLDMIESDQRLRTSSRVGSEDHLHSTALGKAILACMDQDEARAVLLSIERPPRTRNTRVALGDLLEDIDATRIRGYAIDDEENETGARCVASGIRDAAGRPLGALSVSAPTTRFDATLMVRVGEAVRSACVEVERAFIGAEPSAGTPPGLVRQ